MQCAYKHFIVEGHSNYLKWNMLGNPTLGEKNKRRITLQNYWKKTIQHKNVVLKTLHNPNMNEWMLNPRGLLIVQKQFNTS